MADINGMKNTAKIADDINIDLGQTSNGDDKIREQIKKFKVKNSEFQINNINQEITTIKNEFNDKPLDSCLKLMEIVNDLKNEMISKEQTYNDSIKTIISEYETKIEMISKQNTVVKNNPLTVTAYCREQKEKIDITKKFNDYGIKEVIKSSGAGNYYGDYYSYYNFEIAYNDSQRDDAYKLVDYITQNYPLDLDDKVIIWD